MTTGAVVRMPHLRRLGYCSRGVREFFAANGLDYQDFLLNGISEEALSCIEDGMVAQAIEEARNGQQ